MKVLVTGGAGFIGSALVRHLIARTPHGVVNVDALTYAGSLASLGDALEHPRHRFEHVDLRDAAALRAVFERHAPDAVMHLAAESHVDRSIETPREFVMTNVVGTCHLLEAAQRHWAALEPQAQGRFRFLHVSTDEVFGSLGAAGCFTERTPYDPRSPYSASKAAADHLVRAWHHTYGLPVLLTNCSNNYGPYQHPEKLIPLTILNALEGGSLPVYGRGDNVRDWLHVDDHVDALLAVLERGTPGETYVVGGSGERRNIDVVHAVCDLVDEMRPDPRFASRRELVTLVADRPGHDQRYAIDATRIGSQLGWRARETFESGLRRTVRWYIDHRDWCETARADRDRGERLGLRLAVPA